MVDSIGSNLPSSLQAVRNAKSIVQSDRAASRDTAAPSDRVTLSAQAKELTEINRLTSETRQILQDNT
ncbi:MAG: hypothetical protein AB8B83_05000, partial [Bdellovibrionales bacterium]